MPTHQTTGRLLKCPSKRGFRKKSRCVSNRVPVPSFRSWALWLKSKVQARIPGFGGPPVPLAPLPRGPRLTGKPPNFFNPPPSRGKKSPKFRTRNVPVPTPGTFRVKSHPNRLTKKWFQEPPGKFGTHPRKVPSFQIKEIRCSVPFREKSKPDRANCLPQRPFQLELDHPPTSDRGQ